jgi:HD-like signal output (HDOD) protein
MRPFNFEAENKGTDYWVKRLMRKSMPVAGTVIAELNKLSDEDDADINRLAELILRDPNLTSHVLRIANSVQYNASSAQINTITRAIVMIGLKGMRAVCISLMLIDSLLKSGPKERMLELMAQSFHAATQARALMVFRNPDAAEEVFIAALLYNLGEMAYWSSNELTVKNDQLLNPIESIRFDAAEIILGSSFKKITRGLAKQWKLGPVLEDSLTLSKTPSDASMAVNLGEQISRAARKGWDSPAMKALVEEVCVYTSLDAKACLASLKEQAEVALDVAKQFGAGHVGCMIPSRHQRCVPAKESTAPSSLVMKSDPQLQLNILRELTNTTAQKQNVNTVFQMVIEGMHRGIGLERVAVAFVQNYRAQARYSLGHGADHWRKTFDFDVGPFSDNCFVRALEIGGLSWINESFYSLHKDISRKDTRKILGDVDALIYVLEVNGKRPGFIYADRADFGGVITQDQVDSFHHFAAQAQLNLQVLSVKKK